MACRLFHFQHQWSLITNWTLEKDQNTTILLQEYEFGNADGLVQDCNISIANALEILQSCTKPSILCARWGPFCLYLKTSTQHLPDWRCFLALTRAASLSCMMTFRIRSRKCWLAFLLVSKDMEGTCSSRPPVFTLLGACTTTAWPVPNLQTGS